MTSSNGFSTPPPPVSGGDRATIGAGRTAPHSSERMIQPDPRSLVPSIYVSTRGFCFIVFEGHSAPFDWGIRETRGPQKCKVCLPPHCAALRSMRPTCSSSRIPPNGKHALAEMIAKYSAAATQTVDERRSSNGVLRCRAAPALTYFRRKRLDECTRLALQQCCFRQCRGGPRGPSMVIARSGILPCKTKNVGRVRFSI